MKKIITFGLVLLVGCSANRVQLEPQLINNQTVTYSRGSSQLNSPSRFKPELAILEYSSDEMVIALSITNSTNEPILFSENNIKVKLLSSGELHDASIYNYGQVVEEAADKGYNTAAQVGNTAVNIGSGFIPFGGIALSVGRLFYSLGSQNVESSYQDRVDKIAFSNLNQYIRRHTIAAGEQYSGVLKIGFEEDLEEGNAVVFTLNVENEIEKFIFDCDELKGK